MPQEYEFSYQSTKQKLQLSAAKLFVFLLLVFSIYTLGWVDVGLNEKVLSVGGIFTWVWIYANLLRVKIEIQELFIPPFDILHAKEFLIVGLILSLYSVSQTVIEIIRLS